MKPDYEKIQAAVDAAYEEHEMKEHERTVEFIENADIAVCIKVGEDFDRNSLADRIEDILDDIPAVEDIIMFIR